MMNLFDLSGEIAVVVGATGVLGGKVAEGLAQAGARVAVLGRNDERGQACVQRIHNVKGEAQFFAAADNSGQRRRGQRFQSDRDGQTQI
jgi:NAD(P)-dependent dehydrogenase (short-subunit alcohol dehydrogenase family)